MLVLTAALPLSASQISRALLQFPHADCQCRVEPVLGRSFGMNWMKEDTILMVLDQVPGKKAIARLLSSQYTIGPSQIDIVDLNSISQLGTSPSRIASTVI